MGWQDAWQKHRDWIIRQCAVDWEKLAGAKTPLDEVLDLFYRVAQLPLNDPNLDDFWNQLLAAVERYRQTGDPDKRVSCLRDLAVAVETYLKRIVKLAMPEAYASLVQPVEPGRLPREPMLTDLLNLADLGLIADPSRHRYYDFAWRARDVRNKLSHTTPELSELEIVRALADFWLTMLWVTARHKQELESVLFVLPRRSYLEKLQQRWREHVRRWVMLQAEELPADEELGLAELTAGELPADSAEDDLADDEEDETGEEEEDGVEPIEAEQRFASLPELRRGRVHDLFEQVGRLILIADPGAGKTTSLQHYAYLQSKTLLENPRKFRPVPIYVELRYYRDHPEGGLWHLLGNALESNGSQLDDGLEQFRREIARGKWFLLLDGLNEVQGDLQERALRELEQLIGEYPQTRLVITSRRDVPLQRLSLPVFQLDLLTDEQMAEFLRRHFPREREAHRFAQTLRGNPRLWQWGRNPLQLWMLVQVGLKAKGGLPENRGQLLRRFVEHILKREETKGPQTPRDIKLDLLSEIGYQTRQAARVSFPRLQAWQIVGQRSREMGYQVDSAEFVREVCDNHLLADQGEQLAFAHEMYQEYFAACGLKWRYEADAGVLEPLQSQPQWREPLVLLYGLLQNPDNLFQWLVRNEPAVAAECLLSSVQEQLTQLEHLRKRLREVDYAAASEEELGKVLEAIYVLGDGGLLAEHMCQRRKLRRFLNVSLQIAEVFTGEKSALQATLDALKQLGKSANAISHPLLQPLRKKDLKIPPELQREAAELWRTWRDTYKFALTDLLFLASAFQVQSELAAEIRQLIETLTLQGQWEVALQWCEEFGLPLEEFREAAAAAVRRLLEQGRSKAALRGIQAFGLAARYPPEPIIEKLLQQKGSGRRPCGESKPLVWQHAIRPSRLSKSCSSKGSGRRPCGESKPLVWRRRRLLRRRLLPCSSCWNKGSGRRPCRESKPLVWRRRRLLRRRLLPCGSCWSKGSGKRPCGASKPSGWQHAIRPSRLSKSCSSMGGGRQPCGESEPLVWQHAIRASGLSKSCSSMGSGRQPCGESEPLVWQHAIPPSRLSKTCFSMGSGRQPCGESKPLVWQNAIRPSRLSKSCSSKRIGKQSCRRCGFGKVPSKRIAKQPCPLLSIVTSGALYVRALQSSFTTAEMRKRCF